MGHISSTGGELYIPSPIRHIKSKINKKLLFVLILPNIISFSYYIIITGNQFAAHTIFTVSMPAERKAAQELSIFSSNEQENPGSYIAYNAIHSLQGFKDIDNKINLSQVYNQFDYVNRFGSFGSFFSHGKSALWSYYQRETPIQVTDSGIVTVTAYAPSKNLALAIAQGTVDSAKKTLQKMNETQNGDLTHSLIKRIAEVEKNLDIDKKNMQVFRNETKILDPSITYNAEMNRIDSLVLNNVSLKARQITLKKESPSNPVLEEYDNEILYTDQSIEKSENDILQSIKYSTNFEVLKYKENSDLQALANARQELSNAETRADGNHYDISIISPPMASDDTEWPNPLKNRLEPVLITLLITLFIWSLVRA